ncbi:MAG TPA: 8-amino-7-oxononanoate synthase [Lentisphaeria bacterium]|nr:MAG: hypothetical protein A2X47_11945 [Lentisphaerae bacterium GWF2_38_69]HBM16690.1 8-amino-7-oxononanoate synthase [Lentisphaeria bacterium]
MKYKIPTSGILKKILEERKGKQYKLPEELHADNNAYLNSNTTFREFEKYQMIEEMKALLEKYKINYPFFRCYDGIGGASIKFQEKDYINFTSYNYLNLNAHPETLKFVSETIKEIGTSCSASRMTSGERKIHQDLEKLIAKDLYGTEDSLLFVSGHATNVSTISCLFESEDVIFYDALSHNSITEGIKLSKAKYYAFKHNDMDHLVVLMEQHRDKGNNALIVTEGLFGMDGDIPDLPKMIEIKKKYDAFLMIDEAHSLGILGDKGKGLHEHYSIDSREVDIWMGTLSKSLCSCGGYIAGSSELIMILRLNATGFFYSAAMTPANTAAALSSLRLMLSDNERVASLRNNGEYFLNKLKKAKLNTGTSIGRGVIPVYIGGEKKAYEISNLLFDKYKINVLPVTYPAVEEGIARLRFFINSDHTEEQFDCTVSALKKHL